MANAVITADTSCRLLASVTLTMKPDHGCLPPDVTRQVARRQFVEAKGPTRVTCAGCEQVIPIRFLYRCLYCGLWFCQTCGEDHFGQTRAEYNDPS